MNINTILDYAVMTVVWGVLILCIACLGGILLLTIFQLNQWKKTPIQERKEILVGLLICAPIFLLACFSIGIPITQLCMPENSYMSDNNMEKQGGVGSWFKELFVLGRAKEFENALKLEKDINSFNRLKQKVSKKDNLSKSDKDEIERLTRVAESNGFNRFKRLESPDAMIERSKQNAIPYDKVTPEQFKHLVSSEQKRLIDRGLFDAEGHYLGGNKRENLISGKDNGRSVSKQPLGEMQAAPNKLEALSPKISEDMQKSMREAVEQGWTREQIRDRFLERHGSEIENLLATEAGKKAFQETFTRIDDEVRSGNPSKPFEERVLENTPRDKADQVLKPDERPLIEAPSEKAPAPEAPAERAPAGQTPPPSPAPTETVPVPKDALNNRTSVEKGLLSRSGMSNTQSVTTNNAAGEFKIPTYDANSRQWHNVHPIHKHINSVNDGFQRFVEFERISASWPSETKKALRLRFEDAGLLPKQDNLSYFANQSLSTNIDNYVHAVENYKIHPTPENLEIANKQHELLQQTIDATNRYSISNTNQLRAHADYILKQIKPPKQQVTNATLNSHTQPNTGESASAAGPSKTQPDLPNMRKRFMAWWKRPFSGAPKGPGLSPEDRALNKLYDKYNSIRADASKSIPPLYEKGDKSVLTKIQNFLKRDKSKVGPNRKNTAKETKGVGDAKNVFEENNRGTAPNATGATDTAHQTSPHITNITNNTVHKGFGWKTLLGTLIGGGGLGGYGVYRLTEPNQSANDVPAAPPEPDPEPDQPKQNFLSQWMTNVSPEWFNNLKVKDYPVGHSLFGALAGGAIGAGIGGLNYISEDDTELSEEEKKKRSLAKAMLSSAGIGAGIGGLVGGVSDVARSYDGTSNIA